MELDKLTAYLELQYSKFTSGLAAVTASVDKSMSAVAKKFDQTGQKLTTAGRGLTTGVTLPMIAAGVAGDRFADQFEKNLSMIVGLVGVAEDQVNSWRDSILRLGGAVGKSPVELADAMFFITSAGLRGSAALEALEASSRAAASGLGETKSVALTVVSAMNTWADTGLSAQQATDVLVKTVREGNLEASSLAGALGRVLGTAKATGATFADVGGAIAVMTRQGVSVDEAVTALNATFSLMLNNSQEAEQALDAVGLSLETLRDTLSKEGLLAALRLMHNSIGDNVEALATVIPNVRALRGVLSILGQNAETVTTVFDSVKNASGALNDAFTAAEKTGAHKMAEALSRLQAVLIKLGDAIGPTADKYMMQLVHGLERVTVWFTRLTPEAQQFILVSVGVAAALGPVLIVLGLLSKGVGALLNTLVFFGRGVGMIVRGVVSSLKFLVLGFTSLPGLIIVGLVGVIAGFVLFKNTIVATAEAIINSVKFWLIQQFNNLIAIPFTKALNDLIDVLPKSVKDKFGITKLEVPVEIEGSIGDEFEKGFSKAKEAADKDLANIREGFSKFVNFAKGLLPKGLVDVLVSDFSGIGIPKFTSQLDQGAAGVQTFNQELQKTPQISAQAKLKIKEMNLEIAKMQGAFGNLTPEAVSLLQELKLLKVQFKDGAVASYELKEGSDQVLEAFGRLKDQQMATQVGETIASSFEDAIVEGEGLRDTLKALEKDLIRIFTNKLFTEPLGNQLSSWIGGGMTGTGVGGGSGNLFGGLMGAMFGGGGGGMDVASAFASGVIPMAGGGSPRPGDTVLAGENGPELIKFDRPARVFSNEDSKKMMRSGGTQNINNYVTVQAPDGRVDPRSLSQMQAGLAAAVRRGGRNS